MGVSLQTNYMIQALNLHILIIPHAGIYLHTNVLVTPAFIITPTSVNATLGSTATFSCSASAGGIIWLVNGSTLFELNITDITTNSTGDTSSVHIPATEEYNNTNVICSVAIRGVGFEDSGPVVLRVQGIYVISYDREF